MKKIIIFGSSKGIGKCILESFNKKNNFKIINPSSYEVDTSNINLVNKFIEKNKTTDILILNTGGPPKVNFFDISEDQWIKYFNQLFLGFSLILQGINIKKNGYIFLISSHTIKSPEADLVLSNSYRVALSSVLKTVSKIYAPKNISCINIAPGPFKTNRIVKLVKDIKKFEKTLPMKKLGNPKEIAKFVEFIVENKINYINGVTINFDGGLSNNIFG